MKNKKSLNEMSKTEACFALNKFLSQRRVFSAEEKSSKTLSEMSKEEANKCLNNFFRSSCVKQSRSLNS